MSDGDPESRRLDYTILPNLGAQATAANVDRRRWRTPAVAKSSDASSSSNNNNNNRINFSRMFPSVSAQFLALNTFRAPCFAVPRGTSLLSPPSPRRAPSAAAPTRRTTATLISRWSTTSTVSTPSSTPSSPTACGEVSSTGPFPLLRPVVSHTTLCLSCSGSSIAGCRAWYSTSSCCFCIVLTRLWLANDSEFHHNNANVFSRHTRCAHHIAALVPPN